MSVLGRSSFRTLSFLSSSRSVTGNLRYGVNVGKRFLQTTAKLDGGGGIVVHRDTTENNADIPFACPSCDRSIFDSSF